MIQHQAYGLAARPRGGQQQERHLPVVELSAIRVPGVNGSFETARTVLEVAGMALVAIQDGDADPAMIRQRFVALQPVIDMVNPLPQAFGVHPGDHSPDAVGAAHGLPEPEAEKAGVSGEFQSIEAAHARPEQSRDGFDDDGGWDARLQAPVADADNDSPGELEDLLGISDQTAENAQRFLASRRFHSSSETSFRRR